jgi:hypothetical protein
MAIVENNITSVDNIAICNDCKNAIRSKGNNNFPVKCKKYETFNYISGKKEYKECCTINKNGDCNLFEKDETYQFEIEIGKLNRYINYYRLKWNQYGKELEQVANMNFVEFLQWKKDTGYFYKNFFKNDDWEEIIKGN